MSFGIMQFAVFTDEKILFLNKLGMQDLDWKRVKNRQLITVKLI